GLQALAAGLGHQLDAGVERIAALLSLDEPELGPAALEEALEELLEVPVDLLEGLRESLLCAPCHATRARLGILVRADEVVVLRLKEPETLVELTVLVVGDEVHGPDRRQLLLELGDPRPHRLEVAGRVVPSGERRLVHTVRPPRLQPELLTSHTTLGRPEVDLMNRGDEPAELTVDRPLVGLDRAELLREPLVALRGPPNLGVDPVPFDGDLARARVGALPLLGEPGLPVGELRLARASLVDARAEIALDVVHPRELPTQRLHALGGGREGHTTRRRLRHQLLFPSLGGLDRVS